MMMSLMLKFSIRAINSLGAVVGMVAIVIGTKEMAVWQYVIATAVSGLGVGVTVWDFVATRRAGSKRFRPGSDDIKRYLIKWMKSGGRTAIVSRNLSWVDVEAKELLVKKAKSSDLSIYVPHQTELTEELASHGAVIHVHDKPTRARFTIINEGRGDARVAVGAGVDDDHVIDEYSHNHPVLVLAEDLLSRLTK